MSSLLSTVLLNCRIEAEASIHELGDTYADFPDDEFLELLAEGVRRALRCEGLIGDETD